MINLLPSGTDCGDSSCQYNYPSLKRQETSNQQQPVGGTGSRRPHTTLRLNSVKEASQIGDGTVLLKSALKKENPNTTEALSIDGGTSRSMV